jgi:hypothetical protein
MRRLFAASIWAPGAIPLDEWKYRNLKRVWLPVYDVVAIVAGYFAFDQGSNLLNRLFDSWFVDLFGVAMMIVAGVCLAGVAFPALWAVEMLGKVLLLGMVVSYIASILFLSAEPFSNSFVVAMLAWGLPLALFRLNLLGEEWKERNEEAAA